MVKIENVSKKYHTSLGDYLALSGIDLTLPNTGLVALYGENGCGKTTLLNLISTLDTDYNGEIFYNGENIQKIKKIYRKSIVSVVLQENAFISYLNVLDNIMFCLNCEGSEKICVELENFDVIDKKEEYITSLSGGQKQRVSLIRGLLKSSRILLVDEPTSSLDESMEREVFNRLQMQAKEKLVILVSHNISLIRQYADLIIFMDKGTIKSIENVDTTWVEYKENSILIPKTISSFSVLDTEKIHTMLSKNKIISLCYNDIDSRKYNPDYSIETDLFEKQQYCKVKSLRRKIIWRSLSRSKWAIIASIALLVFLSIMLGIICSFARFDKHRFAYDTISNNIDGWVHYECKSISDEDAIGFDLSSYEEMVQRSSSDIMLMEKFEMNKSVGFAESGVYSSEIYGLIFCEKKDVVIKSGIYADASEIMISDYLADGLVLLDEQYSSYEEILKKGIKIDNIYLKISGIIDTDYEKYKGIFDTQGFIESQKYIDYQQNMLIYSSLFIPVDSLINYKELPLLSVSYGEYFARPSIVKDNNEFEFIFDSKENLNSCYISKALANELGDVEYIKISNMLLYIAGVVNFDDENNQIYLTEETYKTICDTILSNSQENLFIMLKNVEEVRYLDEHGMCHNTSVSVYVSEVINIIELLQSIFEIILGVLFIIMTVCCLSLVNGFMTTDKHLFGFMRLCGYPSSEIIHIELKKIGIVALTTMIVSVIIYKFIVVFLNRVLSSLFSYYISILSIELLPVTIMLLGILLSFALGTLTMRKMYKCQIIKLLE